MNVSVRHAHAALIVAWSLCPDNTPFRDYLESRVVTASALIAGGQVSMSSGDGHETRWAAGVAVTAADVVDLAVYLLDEFDRAYTDLTGTPSDAEVKAQMELSMRPIMDVTDNWNYLTK